MRASVGLIRIYIEPSKISVLGCSCMHGQIIVCRAKQNIPTNLSTLATMCLTDMRSNPSDKQFLVTSLFIRQFMSL